MKKKILFAGAAILLAATVVTGYTKCHDAQMSDLFSANVDALASGEGSGGYVICYSESRVAVGYTYYDCGDCTKKIYDEKGRGTYTKCFR